MTMRFPQSDDDLAFTHGNVEHTLTPAFFEIWTRDFPLKAMSVFEERIFYRPTIASGDLRDPTAELSLGMVMSTN